LPLANLSGVSQPADVVSHPSEVGSAGARLPNLARAEIGVIGGSGFYEFLESTDEVSVDTPYGMPSDPSVTGEVAGRKVAFVPRHGRDHRFPHKIPYRANLWALRSLGVRQIRPRPRWAAQPRARPRPAGHPRPARGPTSGRSQTSTTSGAPSTSRR
jgi:5'-methylthioadenosine phosphorylase